MAKSRRVIMRQTITIAATLTVAFSLSYSVILNPVISKAISLCLYQSVEEDTCMGSCCDGIGISSDCCCYFSEMPNQNDSLVLYEPFGKSIYSYMCAKNIFDNSDFMELYKVDFETQKNHKYIAYKIFRPPKA